MHKQALASVAFAAVLALSLSGTAFAEEGDSSDLSVKEASVLAPAVDSASEAGAPDLSDGANAVSPEESVPPVDGIYEDGASDLPDVPGVDSPAADVSDVDVPNADPEHPGASDAEDDAISFVPEGMPVVSAPSAPRLEPEILVPALAVSAPQSGWSQEGGKTYYYDRGKRVTGWLITQVAPDGAQGMQRYWMGKDGALTRGLIDAGGGWFAYGTRDKGYVVRGAYRDPVTGYFYFADGDGRLLTPGWHVTDAFGQGLQRYYIDAKAHAAIPGTSSAGYLHFTRGDVGYVARGYTPTGDGTAFVADNDGRLHPQGWVITDTFGDGLQRYYVGAHGKTTTGLIDAGRGSFAFGVRDKGYVVRGAYRDPVTGNFYFADNDGRLLTPGWHVTDNFGQGLQRYYIDAKAHGAVPGLKSSPWRFFVRGDTGYVARGKVDTGEGAFLASNDGVLEKEGWLVTAAYDGHLERYWVTAIGKTPFGHFRQGGKAYYALPGLGYVVRGKHAISSGSERQFVLADGDGVMEDREGWLITDRYDGRLERYRLDDGVVKGFYGARIGLFRLGEHDYYGRDDQGFVVRGLHRAADGRWYQGNNEGQLQPLPAEWMDMYMLAQEFHSPTDWLILVDTNDPRVGIYHYNYERGGWDVSQEWLCTVGGWGSPTVTGTFYIQDSGYAFGHGYTCYYWTQFYGNYLFHSIKYYQGTFDVMDGRLGVHASLGCVRLDINNAAWLQYNIPRDTKVFVY